MFRKLISSINPYKKDYLYNHYWRLIKLIAYFLMPIKLIRFYLFNHTKNLHVGCGNVKLNNWLNADITPSAQVILDIKYKLPLPSNYFELIYSEHVVEHLTINEALTFFSESRRILKEGGILRIAMPNLDDLVSSYNHNWKDQDWVNWKQHQFIQSNAEMLNVAFHWWGHKYLYNQSELKRRLLEIGFTDIRFYTQNKSAIAALCDLETRSDSTLIAEAKK